MGDDDNIGSQKKGEEREGEMSVQHLPRFKEKVEYMPDFQSVDCKNT